MIADEIREMFEAFDGTQRMWEAVAIRGELVLAARREYRRERAKDPLYRQYHRDYKRNRYQTDAEFRERHKANVRRYKARLRAERGIVARVRTEMPHGYNRYVKRKCRCDECRAASAAYMRERRAARKALEAA